MVQRTAGGIKYDTKVRSSSGSSRPMPSPTKSKGSGSEKLAAYKEATKDTTPGETPKQYRQKVEAQKQASTPSTDVSPMAQAGVQKPDSSAYFPPTAPRAPSIQGSALSQSPVLQNLQREQQQSQPGKYVYNPALNTYQPTFGTRVSELAQKAKEQEYIATQRGYEETQGMQLSPVSQKAYDVTQAASEKLRARGSELKERGPYYYPSGYGLTSVANVVEMAGMIPGGVETIVKKPGVIKPALVVGAVSVPTGIATQAKDDPGQLVSDLAVFSALGYGVTGAASKAGSAVSKAVPKVTYKSAPSEFLIKGRVPETPTFKPPSPNAIKQAEFTQGAFGIDPLKVSQIQSSVATVPKPPATVNVLTGKSSKGYTDVYIKADKVTAEAMRKQYVGNVEAIRTPGGSYTVFEPTGRIPTPQQTTGQFSRIGTPEFMQIGKPGSTKGSFEFPFRFEKRTNLQEGKLTLTPAVERLAIPEYTNVFTTKARPVYDPLQLQSGTITYKAPRPNFLSDTAAQAMPRRQYQTITKDKFVGEMPEMNFRNVRVKQPLTKYKDPADMSFMQKLYDDAVYRGSDIKPAPKYKATVSTGKAAVPGKVPYGAMAGFGLFAGLRTPTHAQGLTQPFIQPARAPTPTAYSEIRATSQPTQSPYRTPSTKQPISPFITPTRQTGTTRTFNYVPELPEWIPRFADKKKTVRKGKVRTKTGFKDIVNPVAEWQDFARGLMK